MTPIYLYIHKMNFATLRVNSYPQLQVTHDVEWRSVNYAFSYDVLRARNSSPQLEVNHDVEWRSLNYAFSYDVLRAINSSPQLEVNHMMLNGSL